MARLDRFEVDFADIEARISRLERRSALDEEEQRRKWGLQAKKERASKL